MNAGPLVVITDCDHPTIRWEEDVFREAGVRLRREQCRTEAEVAARCSDADALLVQYAPIGPEAIAALAHCRVAVRYGVGYDTLDVDALAAAGIWACNVPDYCVDEVSNQALALLLALNRRLPSLAAATAAGRWDFAGARPIHRLAGQTVAVIGFGRIGRAAASKMAAFGLRVLVHDPYVPAGEIAAAGFASTGFEEGLAAADHVSLHVPLSAATRHLVGRRALALLRPGAFLINTARGGVVDEDALAEALRAGRLGGAGLDVLQAEPPPPDHPLLHLPNCIVLPHSAWYSEESFAELKTKAAREVLRVLRGGRPLHPLHADPRPRPR